MQRILQDKEIMARILDELKLKVTEFAESLDSVHRNSIYYVLHGRNGISVDMRRKILAAYPKIREEFIKTGAEPVMFDPNYTPIAENLNEIISIPQQLARIEARQARIEEKLDQLLNQNQTTN